MWHHTGRQDIGNSYWQPESAANL